MTEWLHFHFSLSCTGEGNGNPLQCYCLENPRARRAWWAASMGSNRVRYNWSDLAAAAERKKKHQFPHHQKYLVLTHFNVCFHSYVCICILFNIKIVNAYINFLKFHRSLDKLKKSWKYSAKNFFPQPSAGQLPTRCIHPYFCTRTFSYLSSLTSV